MSEVGDIKDQAAADVFASIADPGSATFNPAAGDPVPNCYVDIRKDVQFSSEGMDSKFVGGSTTLEYLLAQTGQTAKIGESFLVGETTWKVKHILSNDGRFAKVVVK